MATATQEPDQDLTDVPVPDGAVKFYSKSTGLRLVRTPSQTAVNPGTGGVYPLNPGEELSYSFAPAGVLVVQPGQDKVADGVVLPDGTREVQDAITWLRGHQIKDNWFFEEGDEPHMPRPTPAELTKSVFDATFMLDIEALQTLDAEERATHNRTQLLDMLREAMVRVTAALEQQPPPEVPAA